jgi:NAD-dependent SIR2 family protein deacetylase
VVTQNVDGLHQAAGARDVIELHGGLDRVICLHCGLITPRTELDLRLRAANPSFAAVAAPSTRTATASFRSRPSILPYGRMPRV